MTPSARAGRDDPRQRPRPRLNALVLVMPVQWLAVSGAALAQSTAPLIVPSLTVTQTITDNRHLTATEPKSDAVTQISPGISMSSRSGTLQGFFNYVGTGVVYARDSASNTFLNSLSARATAELVEKRFVIDAVAGISQQAISAFGRQSFDPTLNDANRSEVRTFTISPLLRGRLLGEVDYQARLAYSTSRSSTTNTGDTSSLTASLGIGGGRGVFGWGLSGDRSIADQDIAGTGRTTYGSVRASLNYRYDYDLQFGVRGGREANNIVTTQSTNTWGASVFWQPGLRTQASLQYDHRFFGSSHTLAFSHRFARSVWTYTDSRDLSTGGAAGASTISLFDLYFQLFASIEPNPALREQRVREFLRLNGLDPTAQISGGFLSSGNSINRRQSLSFAIQGLRNSIFASAFAGRTTRLGAALVGDLAQVEAVRQTGLSLGWTYRLTPVASVGVSGSLQRTAGSGLQAGNELRSISANWSTALGPSSSASVSLRHNSSDGEGNNNYQESAISGSLSMRF